MTLDDFKNLEKQVNDARDNFLPGMSPVYYVGVLRGSRWKKAPVYAHSTLEVLDVINNGPKDRWVIAKGANNAPVKFAYNRVHTKKGPEEIIYNGVPYADWVAHQNSSAPTHVLDHNGKIIGIGSRVLWAAAPDGVLCEGEVKSFSKSLRGNVTITMIDGTKVGRDSRYLHAL